MDSPYPQFSVLEKSYKTVVLGKSKVSLSTTTSGHVDPMKPLVILFGSGSTDAGFQTTIEAPLNNRSYVNDVIDDLPCCNPPKCIQPCRVLANH